MLLGGSSRRDSQAEAEPDDPDHRLHAEADKAARRPVQKNRPAARQSPSALIDIDSPELLDRLEKLDDVVFDAISGDARALDEMGRLWPKLMDEVGPEKLEESREQYLRYALSIWEVCLEDGLREPERAISSLQVLSIIFGER